jgi:hypothetical protein
MGKAELPGGFLLPSTSHYNSHRGPRGDPSTSKTRTSMRSVWLLGSYISSYHPMMSLQLHDVRIDPDRIGALFVMVRSSVLTSSLQTRALCELVNDTLDLIETPRGRFLMASPDLQP